MLSKQCGHQRTAGEWLSLSHAVMCLGVPRAELAPAVAAGEVVSRRSGWGIQVEVLRADVEARWPHVFVTAAR